MATNERGSQGREKQPLVVIGLRVGKDHGGLWVGLAIVALGVTLLLDQEGVLHVWDVWRFWPLILIVVGLNRLLRSHGTADWVWGMVEILFGVIFQLGALGFPLFAFRRTWPLVVVGAGLWVLYAVLREKDPSPQSTLDFNRADVFGGAKVRVTSKNFRAGEWVAVMGGSQVDFTEADIEGNEATLKIVAIFGGGEIIIPRNWEVQVHGTALFGGHNDETLPAPPESGPRKKLIITGAWVFGGFNVKN